MSISMLNSDFWRNLTKGMLFTTLKGYNCSVVTLEIFYDFYYEIFTCYVCMYLINYSLFDQALILYYLKTPDFSPLHSLQLIFTDNGISFLMLQSSFLHLQELFLDICTLLTCYKLSNFYHCLSQYVLFLLLSTPSNTPNVHKQKNLNIFHIAYNTNCILLLLEYH